MSLPNKIPRAPGNLPLVGHALQLLRDPFTFLNSLPAQGDMVQIRIGPLSAIMLCNPALTRQVLVNDRLFDKGGPFYERMRESVGDALFTCPHDQHRQQRRMAQPAFHRARFPGYAQTMTMQSVALAKGWRHGQVLNVAAEMSALTMAVAVETMFSDALTPQAVQNTIEDIETVAKGILRRAVVPAVLNRLSTLSTRRYQRASARLRQTIAPVIADRRASNVDRGDLLSALLAARDTDDSHHEVDRRFTDTELLDQAVTFLATGTETTANTLAWALHLLARHPEIEERLHGELDAVLAGAPAQYEDLPKLSFTTRIIVESLRLYPIAWIFTRTTTEDTTLGGHHIPAGSMVAVSPYLIQHRSDLYESPERFDPDRWDAEIHPPPPREAFTAFGGGARKCIGDEFSIAEATIALATICALWHMESIPGQGPRPKASIALSPHELRLRANRRQHA